MDNLLTEALDMATADTKVAIRNRHNGDIRLIFEKKDIPSEFMESHVDSYGWTLGVFENTLCVDVEVNIPSIISDIVEKKYFTDVTFICTPKCGGKNVIVTFSIKDMKKKGLTVSDFMNSIWSEDYYVSLKNKAKNIIF